MRTHLPSQYEIKKLKPSTQYVIKIKTSDAGESAEVRSDKMGTVSYEEERTRDNDMRNFVGEWGRPRRVRVCGGGRGVGFPFPPYLVSVPRKYHIKASGYCSERKVAGRQLFRDGLRWPSGFSRPAAPSRWRCVCSVPPPTTPNPTYPSTSPIESSMHSS